MTLVEKSKGLFKPKLTFEQFAIAITSDVRLAVIEEVGSIPHYAAGIDIEHINQRVDARLNREVSRGSLTWHLQKLKFGGILEETPSLSHTVWNLTSVGREAFKLVEKVEREMEAED